MSDYAKTPGKKRRKNAAYARYAAAAVIRGIKPRSIYEDMRRKAAGLSVYESAGITFST